MEPNDLKKYTKAYEELILKLREDPSETITLESYNLITRKLIEFMFDEYLEKNHKSSSINITKFFGNQSVNLKFAWKNINKHNHFNKSEHMGDIQKHNNSFIVLANYFDYQFTPLSKNKIYDNVEWKTTDIKVKKQYSALIENNNNDFYTISHKEKGYEQKNKFIIYSDISLSSGIHYNIDTIYEKMWVDQVETEIIRETIIRAVPISLKNNSLNQELVDIIGEIVSTHQMSPLDFIIAFPENILVKKIAKVFYEGEMLWQIIALKYFDKKTLNANENDSPIEYEFWTKNPRLKGISFFEKKIIQKYILYGRVFAAKENAQFERDLILEKKYFRKGAFNSAEYPGNVSFHPRHNQKKIIQRKDYYTIGEYDNLICQLYKFYKDNENERLPNIIENNTLNKEQTSAMNFALNNKRTIIMGAAGSGKTRLAASIISNFINANESYIFLAPTHKAKSVVTEMNVINNNEVKSETIQKVLKNKHLLMDVDNVIVDEISMINDRDWINLLIELSEKKRIILIGDEKQLSPINSIGATQLIVEDFDFKKIIYVLTKNMRQSKKEDQKEVNSLRKNGSFIKPVRFFESYSNFLDCIMQIKSYEKNNFKIITPINYGALGTKSLNNVLGNKIDNIAIGDKLLISETIKDATFLFKNKELIVEKVENKKITFSNKISQKYIFSTNKNIEGFYFEHGKLIYDIDNIDDIPFIGAKAITVHASQGSTYDKVLFLIPPNYELSSNMLYTAATRFKEEFKILVYEDFDISTFNYERLKLKEHKES